MNKFIFLDIDGVLNRSSAHNEEGMLNPSLIAVFKEMFDKIYDDGSSVVLSSSWKNSPQAVELIKKEVCPLIGCTPNVFTEGTDSTQRRGIEIQAWLDTWTEAGGISRPNFDPNNDKYAIIDDTGMMLDSQLPNFFRTEGHIGLTKEIADKIIEHLK